MSTKHTIYLDDDFHLYFDVIDQENVYLALDRESGYIAQLVVKIPMETWNEMRRSPRFEEVYAQIRHQSSA
jgi:hypothetical protein